MLLYFMKYLIEWIPKWQNKIDAWFFGKFWLKNWWYFFFILALTEIFVWNKCNKSSQNMIYRIKWIIKGKYLEVEILMKYYLKSEENISALRLHGKTSNFLHKFCARNWTFKVILLLFEITLFEKKNLANSKTNFLI